MYEGEYFTIKVLADMADCEKLEVIGIKKHNLPINESDLTFPQA